MPSDPLRESIERAAARIAELTFPDDPNDTRIDEARWREKQRRDLIESISRYIRPVVEERERKLVKAMRRALSRRPILPLADWQQDLLIVLSDYEEPSECERLGRHVCGPGSDRETSE